MLTVSDAIRNRRSIRGFRGDPVPQEDIREIIESARLAPSGSNRQPTRLIVVTEKEEKIALRKICYDQAFIEQAPLVFVCCADLTAYAQSSRKKRTQEFIDFGVTQTLSGRFADPAFRQALLDEPDPDLLTYLNVGMANAYIAIEHMVLTATALGLGSCWVGALGEGREIEDMFSLPPTTVVCAVLPIGYPSAKVPSPRPRIPVSEILLRPVPGL
jgi:nitroreductase